MEEFGILPHNYLIICGVEGDERRVFYVFQGG